MQKRSLLALFLALTSINLVSAQYYGSFSLGNFLSSIDPSTMILGVIFLVSFALLQFALSKYFKEQKTITTTISFAISLLIIWGINQSGIDYGGYFYNFFFFLPSGFVDTLWPLLLLAGFIYLWMRNGFLIGIGKMLIIIGLLLNVIAFSGLTYEPSTPASVGIFLIISGVILLAWGFKKKAVANSGFGRGYTTPIRNYSAKTEKSRRPKTQKQPKGPGFFRRNIGRAGKRMKSGLGKGAKATRKGAGWFGRKAKQTGQEWTRRDERFRRQQEETAKQKRQQKKAGKEQRKQEKAQQKQVRKEEQKMIDYKKTESELQSLMKEYNDLQRKDPGSQRLKDIAKRIKELRKQKKG